ncbi:MAG: glycosyltransferase [Phycisphaeraceae bacterium]|nr:glycosyltransferase [Phycisphaeraceae bacterium]
MTYQHGCDILMLSELAMYPFDQGFKVHGSRMAEALTRQGLNVRIASIEPTPPPEVPKSAPEVPPWLKQMLIAWPNSSPLDESRLITGWSGRLLGLRQKLADHQGIDRSAFAGAMRLVEQWRPRLVIGLGQHSPMMLRAIRHHEPDVSVIWYAADELVSFQLSCLRCESWRALGKRLYGAVLYAALENAFVRGLDAAIGVSPRDAKLLKRIAGPRRVAMIRNGVDLQTFAPAADRHPAEQSVIFWGRMDFEPNIDAMMWFTSHVWPLLRGTCPRATLRIVGKNPTPQVQNLEGYEGVRVTGTVEDVREEAKRAMVVVLPMRCGGGIKNKLLEAAAMGLPIVASPHAVSGLSIEKSQQAMLIPRGADAWTDAILRLWHDPSLRQMLGRNARTWVEREHDWSNAARQLMAFSGLVAAKQTLRLRAA